MPQQLDRPGTFRGLPLEWGVSETRNKFPQFVTKIRVMEFYDEAGELTENKEPGWVAWDYDMEITAFLCLYTQKDGQWKELMSVDQIKKALAWDGLSFESLANGKYGDTMILFRVESETYEGKDRLKVQWIDKADASPIRQLQKYGPEKVKAMDAVFAGVLKGAAPSPAKAPASAPGAGPKAGPAVPPKGKPGPKPKAAASAAAPSTATKPPAGAPAPAPRAPSVPPSSTVAPSDPMTKDQAWEACSTMKAQTVTDEKLAEVWIAEATKIGKAEDQFTPADWAALKDAVVAATGVF
jgi:hypothetical protein